MLKNKDGLAVGLILIIVLVFIVTASMFLKKYVTEKNIKNTEINRTTEAQPNTSEEKIKTYSNETSPTPSLSTYSPYDVKEYKSPGGKYTMIVKQAGDGSSHTLKDFTGKSILSDYYFSVNTLPGYRVDWVCQCGGPYFKSWLSGDYFLVEFLAQSRPRGEKLLKYHMTVDAATGKEDLSTFKLVSSE